MIFIEHASCILFSCKGGYFLSKTILMMASVQGCWRWVWQEAGRFSSRLPRRVFCSPLWENPLRAELLHKTGGMHFEQTAQRQKPATPRKTMLRMARLSVLYTACSPNPEPWGTSFGPSTFLKLRNSLKGREPSHSLVSFDSKPACCNKFWARVGSPRCVSQDL